MADSLDRLQAVLGDRYAFSRELGRGGMATVYLAKDLKHDREVAVKVLHPDLAASIGGDRFEREIRLAGRLQHPHILGMYDSGAADGLLYYVMPFVEGESLRDRLDREGQLPLDDALQIALQVADALGYAHAQQIVHRDIKPENVLISGGHALVADFGIARAVEEGAQKLTQTGMALGTPTYMAPEQGMGEAVGPTADIYSLGCMLFEMLAGEPPFVGKNASAILAKHVMEQVPSVRIIRQSVPEEVELAIFAALGKSPADRPQTCAAFAEMLVAVPSGHTSTRLMTMRHTTARRTMSGMTNAFPVTGGMAPVALWRRPWALALAAVVVLGGGFGAWRVLAGGGSATLASAAGELDPKRIAVLYFEDASPATELGYLADGLTEGLIQALARVPELNVVSRNGVEPYRGATVSPDSIGRALAAGTLVRGSVVPEGDNLRISLALVDGNTGVDLSDSRRTFVGAKSDLIAVSDSLAEEAARLIRARVGTEVRLRDQRSRARNADAWTFVQRAERLRKSAEVAAVAGDTATKFRDFAAADSLLALAEGLDARWVEPARLRGLVAYRLSRLSGRDPLVIRRHVEVGLGHVNRALGVESGNPDALELRGNLRYWSYLSRLEPVPERAQMLLDSAQADLESATQNNPNQAGAWATLSHLYNYTGNTTRIALAATRALEADAYLERADDVLGRLFLAYYDDGDVVSARRWCDETRRRFPGTYPAPRCELFMLTTREDPQPDVARAWRLADSVAAMAPVPRREYFTLNSRLYVAAVLGRAGLHDSARAVAQRSLGDEVISPTRDLSLVAAFAFLQAADTATAIDQLGVYFNANPQARPAYGNQPGWWFRGISTDPRYQQLTGGR